MLLPGGYASGADGPQSEWAGERRDAARQSVASVASEAASGGGRPRSGRQINTGLLVGLPTVPGRTGPRKRREPTPGTRGRRAGDKPPTKGAGDRPHPERA